MSEPLCLRDIMTHPVVIVHLDDTLERVRAIFEASKFHHLVVVDGHRVVGVLSDRDLLKHVSPFIGRTFMERGQDLNTLRRRVHQVMSRDPVVARDDMPLLEAGRFLLEHAVTCLPVVDEADRLCGVVTWRDLLPRCFACTPPAAGEAEAA
ncbi:MAG: CBS domain-containing protein [Phycisphaerales bacterium]|nr:CBS domain-containing protein [Phycisphaerales bacterium]